MSRAVRAGLSASSNNASKMSPTLGSSPQQIPPSASGWSIRMTMRPWGGISSSLLTNSGFAPRCMCTVRCKACCSISARPICNSIWWRRRAKSMRMVNSATSGNLTRLITLCHQATPYPLKRQEEFTTTSSPGVQILRAPRGKESPGA
jgi:hypothetical protein